MDAEIDAYRTVLRDQPITAPEIGKWMAETVQDKRRLENLLGHCCIGRKSDTMPTRHGAGRVCEPCKTTDNAPHKSPI